MPLLRKQWLAGPNFRQLGDEWCLCILRRIVFGGTRRNGGYVGLGGNRTSGNIEHSGYYLHLEIKYIDMKLAVKKYYFLR